MGLSSATELSCNANKEKNYGVLDDFDLAIGWTIHELLCCLIIELELFLFVAHEQYDPKWDGHAFSTTI